MADMTVYEMVVGWELILVDEKVKTSDEVAVGQLEAIAVVMSVYFAAA